MEPIFEVRSVLDVCAYERMHRVMMRLQHMGALYGTFAGLFFFLSLVLMTLDSWVLAILLLALGVFLIVLMVTSPKTMAKRAFETNRFAANLPYTVRFFAEDILDFTPKSEERIRYDELYRVVRTADALFLFISDSKAIVLPFAAFTRGTAQGLFQYLCMEKRVPYKIIT